MEDVTDTIKIDNQLNPESGDLPFGLYCPELEGKLVWICGYDQNKKVTSIFCHNGEPKEKRIAYLEGGFEEAKHVKEELEKNGWKKLIPPKIKITMPDGNNNNVPLNRKQTRYLSRKVNNEMKKAAKNLRGKDEDE